MSYKDEALFTMLCLRLLRSWVPQGKRSLRPDLHEARTWVEARPGGGADGDTGAWRDVAACRGVLWDLATRLAVSGGGGMAGCGGVAVGPLGPGDEAGGK